MSCGQAEPEIIGGYMLQVNRVSKRYRNIMAVEKMGFEVAEGEVCVLLGPNGAGKSTIIKCIAGLLQYEGAITVAGYINKDMEAKKIMSYIPESPALFDLLTVKEHLHFIARAYRLQDFEADAEALLERFDLLDKADKLGKELSKGMLQKLSICCGVLTRPKVILFDEPMIGLDPKAIKELKKLFVEFKEQGCAVLISTHMIDSIKEVWDKILIMDKGRIVSTINRGEADDIEERFFAVTGVKE
jgi:ABC-2 type transport system ATP-binding protein